jgi:tryptophanyl-tRNA synthetase
VVFPEPDALLSEAPLILGTDGTKMSKSKGNVIELRMTADETARKIKGAKTDSDRHITYDPESRPEVANLLVLIALCEGTEPAVVAEELGDGGGGALKKRLTDAVNTELAPLRKRRAELEADPAYLAEVLGRGNARANEVAGATLDEVRARMGMAYDA